MIDLWKLVESLQHYSGIVPNPPRKIPKTNVYNSRFYSASTPSQPCTSTQPDIPGPSNQSDPDIPGPSNQGDIDQLVPEARMPSISEESAAEMREWFSNLTLEQVQDDPKLIASKLLKTESWGEMAVLSLSLSALVTTYLELPSTQCTKIEITDSSYIPFIPSSVPEKFKVVESSADGNCMFNSISTILTGGEESANFYRLIVAVDMVDRLPEFAKYILLEFKDNWREWLQLITEDPSFADPNLDPMEAIENVCRKEIMETLKSFYRDCSILHVHFAAQFLKRPIQLHCVHGDESCRTFGFLQKLYLPPFDITNRAPLHLVWVPVNPTESQVICHIVPAVGQISCYNTPIDHCPLLAIETCLFVQGANQTHSQDMVQCVGCHQKFHCLCIHEDFGDESFCCGCVDPSTLQLKNYNIYSSPEIVDKLKEIDLRSFINDVVSWPSLRKFIYMQRPQFSPKLKLKLGLRMGPFINDDVNHDIMMMIQRSVPAFQHQFVPDFLLKEVFLHLIMMEEKITRGPAEFVLSRMFQTY